MLVVYLKEREFMMVKFLNLEEHTERLFHSASRLGFEIPFNQEIHK